MVDLHPNDARGYGGKARILYKLQRYAEAITVYDAAIALDPNNAEYAEKKQKAEKRLKNTQKRWGFLDF
jgi:tetratricopeptide (TPR) repeat protein